MYSSALKNRLEFRLEWTNINMFTVEGFSEIRPFMHLKVHLFRFENLPICSNSYKNNILKVFHS